MWLIHVARDQRPIQYQDTHLVWADLIRADKERLTGTPDLPKRMTVQRGKGTGLEQQVQINN